MGEGVHTSRGGDFRRQIERQFWIGEYRIRQNLRRENHALDVRRIVRNHARPANFTAGAGRCGQRDEIGQFSFDRAHVRMIPSVFDRITGMRRKQTNDLGDIQRRAAAEANYAIRVMIAIGGCARHDLAGDGIALNPSKHAHFQAMQASFELR